LKKQVSPIVTVIVILVVVVIVALLWNRFANPPQSAGGRGGMSLNIDMSKADLKAARKKALEARNKFMEQAKQGAAKKEGGE
jgi:hypothetical protein